MENAKFIKIGTLYSNSRRNIFHRRGREKNWIYYRTLYLYIKIDTLYSNSTRHIFHRRGTDKIEYITEFLVKNASIHSKHTAVINRFIGITEILYKRFTGTVFRHKINKYNGINATYSRKIILYTTFRTISRGPLYSW